MPQIKYYICGMSKKYNSTTSIKRRLVCYPSTLNYKMAVSYSFNTNTHRSDTIEMALNAFFNTFSVLEKEKLLRLFDSMTEEQKKYPAKL